MAKSPFRMSPKKGTIPDFYTLVYLFYLFFETLARLVLFYFFLNNLSINSFYVIYIYLLNFKQFSVNTIALHF